ncbi:type II toxin-antitoxin system HicB family antitoxin [Methylocystis sp. Sn-Cys]|uniref:type II toxin-antitoxin system HicB family antitoxin n=1 Tax=Methylocystis sp. Sn-Cys TaxID=1701263 RepID=UPI001922A915|nr:type II toxin-antitoxin system HicB family antitoxin [Methylocystis sp. Sn-Cys]MBL1257497.1 type II toxin-antitoxin system HicB family antitoxin [Methylocystis sp. Sn-Cys]
MDRYPVDIFWSDEDEGFIAVAKDLPGCSAFGASRAEASREIEDAIAAWIEAARSAGNPVPEPSAPLEYSGKLLVRMPKTLHRSLALSAAEEGVSLNQYVVYKLAQPLMATIQPQDQSAWAPASTQVLVISNLKGRTFSTAGGGIGSAETRGIQLSNQSSPWLKVSTTQGAELVGSNYNG